MSNALNQVINAAILRDEVNQIIIDENGRVDSDDIDFCLILDLDPSGDFILKGIFEIRKTGNYKKNIFKSSNSVSTVPGLSLNVPEIIKALYYLKHDRFIKLITDTTQNLVLKPTLLNNNPPTQLELKYIYYKLDFILAMQNLNDVDYLNSLAGGGGNQFPSPPATGTNQ